MANDFSWKRDIKNVDWQSTLKYNLIRSTAAGVVWGVLMLVTDPAHNVLPALFAPVSFLVGYLIFFLPFGLAASAAARLPFPYAGLVAGAVAAFLSLMIAVGDPLVYLLFKQKPEWIPVDHPGIFNFRLIIFIIGDPSQPRVPRAASPVPPPQSTAPNLVTSAPSSQTVAPSSQGSPGGTTQSSFAPQSATTFFRSKPFIVLVIAAVGLCGGVALLKSLAEKTALSFDLSLDGKAVSAGKVADVRVDGQPFTSGSKIGVGRHAITVQLQDAEPLDQHFWVLYGAKNLGTLPLESSRGSLTVAVSPSPAKVVVKLGAEIVRDGTAPLTVEKLRVGDYTLVVSRGDYEEVHSVRVQRQQQTDARIDLKLGNLDLSSEPPGAEFDLSGNGRHWQGKLPTRINYVPVGTYQLTARREGWELSADVSVSQGITTSNRTEFAYGSIEVTSEPSGFGISTNGMEVGRTPATLRELKPGEYALTVTDGKNNLTETVTVIPKQTAKQTFLFPTDAAAQYSLGNLYATGRLGVLKNPVESVAWYRKAAEQGYAAAQSSLAWDYAEGVGLPKDDTEAVAWYRKAAEQGNAAGQNGLGFLYSTGRGVTKDDVEAAKWYRRAAEQGYAKAQMNLGLLYALGQGLPKDPAEAVAWYRKAAEQGYAAAQSSLAWDYENGVGLPRDDAEAVAWYRKAADQGYAAGQNGLGVHYGSGRGVTKDDVEAAKWYRKAAEQGNADAQSNLAWDYENGVGLPRDDAEAVTWYRRATEQGHAAAQNGLGFHYDQGRGVSEDHMEAAKWFRKSADQGLANAQRNLGLCYANGRGVPQDQVEAYKWYYLAAAQKNNEAINGLTELSRVLTPGQIAEAKQRAAQRVAQAPQTVVVAPQAQHLGIADIKALTKAGVSDDAIISEVRISRTVYHLSSADISDLRNSGVSNKVIDFMINTPSLIGGTSGVAPENR